VVRRGGWALCDGRKAIIDAMSRNSAAACGPIEETIQDGPCVIVAFRPDQPAQLDRPVDEGIAYVVRDDPRSADSRDEGVRRQVRRRQLRAERRRRLRGHDSLLNRPHRRSNVQTRSASITQRQPARCVRQAEARWRAFSAAASSAIAALTGTVSQPSTNLRAAASASPADARRPHEDLGPRRSGEHELVVPAPASASTAASWCASSTASAAIATLASRTTSRATRRAARRGSQRVGGAVELAHRASRRARRWARSC